MTFGNYLELHCSCFEMPERQSESLKNALSACDGARNGEINVVSISFSAAITMARLSFLVSILLVSLSNVSAFYLPGAAPRDYKLGEAVDLYVNALTPMLTGANDAKLVSSRQIRRSLSNHYAEITH